MLKLVFLCLALAHYIQAECPEGCKEQPHIYEDLHCKPVYKTPTDCCPTEYDCSHLGKIENGKCFLRGKIYTEDETIPDLDCNLACFCRNGSITCAAVDCPPAFREGQPEHCYPTFKLDSCCSVGETCGDSTNSNLTKCTVGEKTYLEGQSFDTLDQCMTCVCAEGFEGEFIEPFCKKITCSSEIYNFDDIKKNCAPVYFSKGDCCPIGWMCPSDEDKYPEEAKAKDSSDLQCAYGDKILSKGDTFKRSEVLTDYDTKETNCECKVPPFVRCEEKHIYDMEKVPDHLKEHLHLE